MILYKNVDIVDLESIMEKGILSLDVCGNNNWIDIDKKRANNPTDKVYLFSPLTEQNTFVQYGVALLEISIPETDVQENQMLPYDTNVGKYTEYITDEVKPVQITNIYIPILFKPYVNIPENISDKIIWCGISAEYYAGNELESCPDYVLEKFAKTARLEESCVFNFFRGHNEDGTVTDIYNVKYDFGK